MFDYFYNLIVMISVLKGGFWAFSPTCDLSRLRRNEEITFLSAVEGKITLNK